MRLRPFEENDAQIVLSWSKDLHEFRMWSADRYESYPPSPMDMVRQYDADGMFPKIAYNRDGKVIGHVLLRYTDAEKKTVRLGFVVVNDEFRGRGYGKAMIRHAIFHAKKYLNAEKITLGVFQKNVAAIRCYEAVGFTPTGKETYSIDGESWECLEMSYAV